ncbi:MAG: restriction endonuclease subunit S [Prevotella sp.]|nr:restriction endonuclease subunit S [Prevotella sp.]
MAKISSGKSIPASEIFDNFSEGLYPCYGGNGIRGYVGHYSNDGLVPVIGRVGALCGNVHLPNEKFYATEHALVVNLKTNDKPHFIEYLLSSLNLRQYAKGVAQPVLSASTLSEIPIPVPPLPVQERIVSELDLLSSIIEKKKAQLKEYDQLAQSIFYDMFGDPVMNEKGWEVKKIGELSLEMRYGTSRPACEDGQYNYLRMGNLTNEGYLNLKDLKRINIPESEIEKCLVRKGDVLFNRTNSLELIGKTCLFDLDEPMVIAGYLIRVRFNETILPLYFTRLFNLSEIKKKLRSMAKGAVNQANINAKELASITIPLPPLSLQQSFAEKIEAIERQKELIKQSIAEAEALFNSRMDYWFN